MTKKKLFLFLISNIHNKLRQIIIDHVITV